MLRTSLVASQKMFASARRIGSALLLAQQA
jgi:hypothetical protein